MSLKHSTRPPNAQGLCDSTQPETDSWVQGPAVELGEMPPNGCRLVTKALPLRMEDVFERSPADLTDLTTSGNHAFADRDLRGYSADLVVANGETIDPLEDLAPCEEHQRLKMGCVVAHRRAVFLKEFAIDVITLGVLSVSLQMLPRMIAIEALAHESDAGILRRLYEGPKPSGPDDLAFLLKKQIRVENRRLAPALLPRANIEPNVPAIEDLDRPVPGRESEIVRFGTIDHDPGLKRVPRGD